MPDLRIFAEQFQVSLFSAFWLLNIEESYQQSRKPRFRHLQCKKFDNINRGLQASQLLAS